MFFLIVAQYVYTYVFYVYCIYVHLCMEFFYVVLLCVMSQYHELNLEINKSIYRFGIREFVAASNTCSS